MATTNVIIGNYLDENGVVTESGDMTATSTEINAGSTPVKAVTPKELKDSDYKRIHVGTTAPADTTMLWLDIS